MKRAGRWLFNFAVGENRLYHLVTTSTLAYHVFSFLTACCLLVEILALIIWLIEFPRKGILGHRVLLFEMRVPFWIIVLPMSVLPTTYAIYGRRYRLRISRAAKGLCLNCGYDLRATPDRCPECGAIPEGAKGAAT